MKLPVNNISHSTINGPGNRLVIWVQGCPLRCEGCFNPETHSFDINRELSVVELAKRINTDVTIEGITISGGEPLQYPKAIIELLDNIDKSLTRILYTGYTLEEIMDDKLKLKVLKYVDLAIVGRYDNKLVHPYFGKKFLNITGKINLNNFKPLFRIEYSIDNNKVTRTGIFNE